MVQKFEHCLLCLIGKLYGCLKFLSSNIFLRLQRKQTSDREGKEGMDLSKYECMSDDNIHINTLNDGHDYEIGPG